MSSSPLSDKKILELNQVTKVLKIIRQVLFFIRFFVACLTVGQKVLWGEEPSFFILQDTIGRFQTRITIMSAAALSMEIEKRKFEIERRTLRKQKNENKKQKNRKIGR